MKKNLASETYTKKSEKGQRNGAIHLQSRRELDVHGQDVLEKMPTLPATSLFFASTNSPKNLY